MSITDLRIRVSYRLTRLSSFVESISFKVYPKPNYHLDEHPDGWDDDCWCRDCRSYQ